MFLIQREAWSSGNVVGVFLDRELKLVLHRFWIEVNRFLQTSYQNVLSKTNFLILTKKTRFLQIRHSSELVLKDIINKLLKVLTPKIELLNYPQFKYMTLPNRLARPNRFYFSSNINVCATNENTIKMYIKTMTLQESFVSIIISSLRTIQ